MKMLMRLAIIATVWLSVSTQAYAQSPHRITWRPQTAAPGTPLTIAGNDFLAVRIPVRDLGSSKRYIVSFLARHLQGFFLLPLTTIHSTTPLTNPIDIDGFNAEVTVVDGRSYAIGATIPNPSQYTFTVTAEVTCTAVVKVGATLLQFSASLTGEQQPETNIGPTPNAVPFAEWGDYTHPTALVTGCDRWIDYISITPVN